MLAFERLALVYFTALILVAAVRAPGRLTAAAAAASLAAIILLAVTFGSPVFRSWLPHVYLVGGYWVPALIVRRSHRDDHALATRFEHWLVATDRVIRPRLPALPVAVVIVTELAYLMCYPLVPISLAVVWTFGGPHDVARFWMAVLAAGYASYVSLPWLLSRPPRVCDPHTEAPRGLSAVNALVLGRVSHQWNTFPSGHVAVSLAAAMSAAHVSLKAGAILGAVAAAVAVGAAAGRYHYVVDVAAGVLVAAVVAMLTW